MNILAIAPYQNLLALMEEVGKEYPEVDLTLVSGNLDDALVSTLTVFHRNFDAVISRGGTALTLEEEFTLPIVSIDVSAADIALCLRDLGGAGHVGRVAAVGFENALRHVEAAAAITEIPIDRFPIDYEDELDFALDRIEEGGYDTILGDAVSWDRACERGLNAHLVTSGADSVRAAIEHAIQIVATSSRQGSSIALLHDIIRAQGIRLVVFTEAGQLLYSTLADQDAALLDELERHAANANPPARFLFRHAGSLYTARTLVRESHGRRMVAFTITSEGIPSKERIGGITYLSQPEVLDRYRNSTFYILGAENEMRDVLISAGRGMRPICLEGETGSGKPRAAQALYLLSNFSKQPFIEIDLDLMDDKSWEFLISSHRSPLYETGSFLHFRSLHMLSGARWRELLGVMRKSLLHERCKLVFSCNLDPSGEEPEAAYRISEALDCLTIAVPPLRRMRIPAHAPEQYLASLAHRDGREATLLTDEAAEIVSSYHWPHNIMQFKQVMSWAYAAAGDGPITAETIREALSRNEAARFTSSSTPNSSSMIDILKPLSQTSVEIARMVVESYGGNRTLAAKTLGISRTTLWNMLKREG